MKSVTRFARNSLECIESIRILKANGTTVYFENDGIDTETMNSEMILYIKSAFAQSESLSGSKRVSTACRMRMENGTFVTTSAPFGYRLLDKKLVVEPEEAEIVRRIFNLYLCGSGISKIITELNETAKEYAPWGIGRIRYILRNEKYIGDSLWQKSYTPAVLPLRNIRNKGEVDQYYAEGTQEAIIDKEIFQKVRQIFNKKAERISERSEPQKRPYTKVLYCGDCGWAYKPKHPKDARRWVCSGSGIAGQSCCSTSVTETEIERTFVSLYNRLKQHEDLIIQKTLKQLVGLKKHITVESDQYQRN